MKLINFCYHHHKQVNATKVTLLTTVKGMPSA